MIFKKVKKSFTLVELSVVLLILSMLLGTVLVGRKIVDRAKMQRVIFEIDYYKKSLSLFRDTFDVLPGNMDKETCMKYAEFSQLGVNSSSTTNVGDYCASDRGSDAKARMTEGYVNSSVIATSEKWSAFLETMREMKTGKVIDEVETNVSDAETVVSVSSTTLEQGPNDTGCRECISYENVKKTQGIASFDSSVAITLGGVYVDNAKNDARKLNFIRGSNDYNGSGQHELKDDAFMDALQSRNVLFVYRNTPADLDANFGAGAKATGALSADIANKLDVKLDDGKPGTGSVLAFKNGYVKKEGLTDGEKKKICYNTLQNAVSTAYYTAESESEYGCNLAIVMK